MNSTIDPTILPLTVYFDKSCPICREEIAALKSIDANDALTLVDCSSPEFNDAAAQERGLTSEELKAAMHVRDAKGNWYLVVDAFVVMYEAVGFDSAAALLQKRGFRSLFEWIYPLFAKHRHKLRYIGADRFMPWLIRRSAAKQAAKAAHCAIKDNESGQKSSD
ncbi:MAG: thiol-disulfide oxidoreductase DCC family protein [Gammaproteobacteria bacterium]